MQINHPKLISIVAVVISMAALAMNPPGAIAQGNTEQATTPQTVIAVDSGTWGSSSRVEPLSFFDTANAFSENFYEANWLNIELWHPQHVVRLSNKDGRAYFAVSQSREHNGYLTVLRTTPGHLDPATDLIVPSGPNGAVGEYVWQDVYTGSFNGTINPVGNWSHPGKMDVIGGVLIVAAQNWAPAGQSKGTTIDKVLFYDVSDPEHPRYWGAMDANELGVKEVSAVGLVRAPDRNYLLTAGGDGTYANLSAAKISPDIRDWTRIEPNRFMFSGQHGTNFNSYQRTTAGNPASGVERVMYFDADSDSFTFLDYGYNPATRTLVKTGEKSFGMRLPGADRDWDTSSLYVSRNGTPIIYTVKSQKKPYYELYQAYNP